MRNLKRWSMALLMTLTLGSMSSLQVMAAEMPISDEAAVAAMEQLRMEDKGPDLSEGELISEVWGFEEDGTPYVERTYMKYNSSVSRLVDTVYYSRTKTVARGTFKVWADFQYDTVAKTVYASNEGGSFKRGGGGELIEESTSISGNGTTKAVVTYKCKLDSDLGGTGIMSTYSVSVGCDYNGNKK